MDPITIAALFAMIGGAGLQYKSSTDAANRQRKATMESLQRQKAFQMQAEQKAMDTAKTFQTDDRQKEQAQIEQEITADLVAPVAEAQAANDINSKAAGNVSQDYNAAKVASNVNQMKQAEALARLMGKTTSASRLRQNESVRFADAAGDVDRISNFASRQYGADQIGIEEAGRPSAGMQLAGGLLSAAGGAGLAYGAGGGTLAKLFSKAPIGGGTSGAMNITSAGPIGFA